MTRDDIGSERHLVAVPAGRDEGRCAGWRLTGLEARAQAKKGGVTTVAWIDWRS